MTSRADPSERFVKDFGSISFMVTPEQAEKAETRETVPSGVGGLWEFHGTPYDTAHDKVLWWKQFLRFVKLGWRRSDFTRRLYDGLHVKMFGHIAEFSIHGFYGVWFSGPVERARWVHYAVKGGPYGFHAEDRMDCWGDVERAVALWLAESGTYAATLKAADEKVRSDELAQLHALKQKYPDAEDQDHDK